MKKADKIYAKLSYSRASKMYESLREKESNAIMLSNLADCYYHMGKPNLAESVYREMITDIAATPEDYYQYAQVLKENGKYEESNKWMLNFYNKDRADYRAIEFMSKKDEIERIIERGERFSIKNLDVNTEGRDFGGYFTPKTESVYFISNRYYNPMVKHSWMWNEETFLDIYKGTKGTNNEIENPEKTSRKINSRYHEGPLAFMPDESYVFFTRNNLGKAFEGKRDENKIQNLKMYYGKVENDGSWTDVKEVPFNNREYSVGHPTISRDGKIMYFVSDMPAGVGGADIYKVQISKGSGDIIFGTPLNLGVEINTEGQEMFPFLDTSGNLYFASDGHVGLGGLDIFVAQNALYRDKLTIDNVGLPVNSARDDFAFALGNDNITGYFTSNRENGKGDDDIYSLEMFNPLENSLVVRGLVLDAITREVLPGAEVILRDVNGKEVGRTKADKDGSYSVPIKKDMEYELEGQKPQYLTQKISANTFNLPKSAEFVSRDLEMSKESGVSLYALVTDRQTGAPIDNVRLKVIDLKTQEVIFNLRTPETGDAFKSLENKIGDCLKYQVVITKEGYLGKTLPYEYCIKKGGVIKMQESLDIRLQKADVGMDVGKLISISPIYFDLNKSNIRPDAAIELIKIVNVMNDNPTMEIELGSHTDCRSSYAYNEKLSDLRAKASTEWVRSRISNPNRIYGKGYGESKLVNDCACEGELKSNCSEADHQANRRTEFIIIKM
ncbi:MAG: OmpA family protein [Bacteroidetes bacterium]|nr:OmpA family protein [Bacteroidota bacterium]